ncbi:Nicotinamide/nicotinic acid mononucleotide adenylyltransferase [Diplonema papillatum]|nr:Nicotinamide/nicotinic acid mononucleotide adenylyltransferase [Diplonema papillatum]
MGTANAKQRDPAHESWNAVVSLLEKAAWGGEARELAVLLSTGSFCPPHREHVQMLQRCKAAVESGGTRVVVAGLISPSHDSYVAGKLGRPGVIRGVDRQRMLAAGIAEEGCEGWLFADPWEIHQPRFVDHPQTCRALKKHASKAGVPFSLTFVCGADLYRRCCRSGHGGIDSLAVVGRDGSDLGRLPPNVLFVPQISADSASSTKVRDLARGDDTAENDAELRRLLHDSVRLMYKSYLAGSVAESG